MKIAIIADIHDNDAYLKIFLDYCRQNNVETVLCCGDVTTIETLEEIDKIAIPVYIIKGNAELYEDEEVDKLSSIHLLGRSGGVTLAERKIGLCHEPRFIEKMLAENYYIIFHGHTHKPWIESRGATHVINPGTLGGVFTPSTFAVWDTAKPMPELVRTETLI